MERSIWWKTFFGVIVQLVGPSEGNAIIKLKPFTTLSRIRKAFLECLHWVQGVLSCRPIGSMDFVRTDKSIYYFWSMLFCRFVNPKNAVSKQLGYFSYISSFWEFFPSSTFNRKNSGIYIRERNFSLRLFEQTNCSYFWLWENTVLNSWRNRNNVSQQGVWNNSADTVILMVHGHGDIGLVLPIVRAPSCPLSHFLIAESNSDNSFIHYSSYFGSWEVACRVILTSAWFNMLLIRRWL